MTSTPRNNTVHVFILAAGKGARMLSKTPKPLTSVAGKPLIDRMIAATEKVFGDSWSLIVGHGAGAIRKHLGTDVQYVHQRTQRGTGHALKIALKSISETHPPDFLVVLPGDHPLLDAKTLRELFYKGVESGAPITVGTVIAPGDFSAESPFWSAGRVIRGVSGNILRIVELRDADRDERAIPEVNVSCYVFRTDWLLAHINKLRPMNAAKEYYMTDLVRIAALEGERIAAYTISNWREGVGINTPEDLRFVEEIILGKSISY